MSKSMDKQQKEVVSEFILREVENHPADLLPTIAQYFGFTRQRAHAYVNREVKKGTLIKVGKTKKTRYFLSAGNHIAFETKLVPNLKEDLIWVEYIKPMITKLPENVRTICGFGFTEIFNNAIDHSGGSEIYTDVKIINSTITITVMDNGVGIFNKIKEALNLETAREAILHLSKGKFTTDPSKHTGEGIFFTSRAFDSFSISSEEMFYTFTGRDWFLSPERQESFGRGTAIEMVLQTTTQKNMKEVISKFTDQDIGFSKTIVAVALSADENDPHVSRSQAKRLMLGLEKFKTIVLDFKGVPSVGQAFIDQVFRIFRNEYPNSIIRYNNANEAVEDMIKRYVPDADDLKLS